MRVAASNPVVRYDTLSSTVVRSADGSVVAAQGGDHQSILYDVATGIRLGDAIPVGDNESNYMALSLDGTRLAIGGGPHDAVKIWNLNPGHWVDLHRIRPIDPEEPCTTGVGEVRRLDGEAGEPHQPQPGETPRP